MCVEIWTFVRRNAVGLSFHMNEQRAQTIESTTKQNQKNGSTTHKNGWINVLEASFLAVCLAIMKTNQTMKRFQVVLIENLVLLGYFEVPIFLLPVTAYTIHAID